MDSIAGFAKKIRVYVICLHRLTNYFWNLTVYSNLVVSRIRVAVFYGSYQKINKL
jgi:hypothetical protein